MEGNQQSRSKFAAFIHRVFKLGALFVASFGVLTAIFWFFLCTGSWQDTRQIVPNSGCIEFDLRPDIEGRNIAPNKIVFTDYNNGYVFGYTAIFNFAVTRPDVSEGSDPNKALMSWLEGKESDRAHPNDQVKAEWGIARIVINPFTLSFTLKSTTEGFGDRHYPMPQSAGVKFKWQANRCSDQGS